MGPAAMVAAGVPFAVLMIVVVTVDVGIKLQLAGKQRTHRLVRTAGYTAVQLDPRRGKCRLGSTANAAADQNVHLKTAQDPRQGAVALPVGVYDLCGQDGSVGNIVDFKLLRVAKVLKDLTLFS